MTCGMYFSKAIKNKINKGNKLNTWVIVTKQCDDVYGGHSGIYQIFPILCLPSVQ